MSANVQYPGAVASLSFGVENIRNNLEVDILCRRWVARIGVTRSTQACFLTADRQCTQLPLLISDCPG